jgi:acyl-CoA dehydrogenase
MADTSDLLRDMAERLFAEHATKNVLAAAEAGTWPAGLWNAVAEAGLPAALLPEAAGGFGASVADAFAVIGVAARHSAPIPLAETMLAGRLLALAGLPVPDGPLTVAPVRREDRVGATRAGADWRLVGSVHRVPWGRAAGLVVVADGPDGPLVAALPPGAAAVTAGANLAGEPRDTLAFDATVPASAVATSPVDRDGLRAWGAALRTAQLAGALGFVLELTVGYANTRVQFGKPIGKFQAIQQNLALAAGEVATAVAAADLAAEAIADGGRPLLIAAAKARAGEAAGKVAAICHQTHGAIGFTQEYELHHATRRLWSWRDEFGNEAEWNRLVGRAAAEAGGEALWRLMTAA